MDGCGEQWFGPGETALRLGVTIKALRVYEREGLVAPQRAPSGWRLYGPSQMARLHQIIVLRDLGLPLAAIGKLVGSRSRLRQVLGLQRESLLAQRAKVDRALTLIEAAQRRLEEGHDLSLDDLATLTRETVVQQPTPTKEFETRMEALVAEHDPTGLASKTLEDLKAKMQSDGDPGILLAEITGMLAEARLLLGAGDYECEAAKQLVRKWREKTVNIKRPPEAQRNVIRDAFNAAVAEAEARQDSVPIDAEALAFISQVARGMKERGEVA
jgi:DNA-binding transcriptional MerR regulator